MTLFNDKINRRTAAKPFWASNFDWMSGFLQHPYIDLPNFVAHLTRKPYAYTTGCKCKITRFNLASRETSIKRFLAWMRSDGATKLSTSRQAGMSALSYWDDDEFSSWRGWVGFRSYRSRVKRGLHNGVVNCRKTRWLTE